MSQISHTSSITDPMARLLPPMVRLCMYARHVLVFIAVLCAMGTLVAYEVCRLHHTTAAVTTVYHLGIHDIDVVGVTAPIVRKVKTGSNADGKDSPGQPNGQTNPGASLASSSSLSCSWWTSRQQLRSWEQAIRKEGDSLACSHHKWMEAVADGWTAQDMVVFDVGCNKGYGVAHMLQLLVPRPGFSNALHFKNLADAATALHVGRPTMETLCGGCTECRQKVPLRPAGTQKERRGHLHIHCFEPSRDNYQLLRSVQGSLVPAPMSLRASLGIHNLALSEEPGVADFPTQCGENCTLDPTQGAGTEKVKVAVSTVAQQMKERNVSYIDVLRIGAVGYDPAVLSGAESAFARRQVGVVAFEHRPGVGLWRGTSLKDVVEGMRKFGYVCFLDGRSVLAQLTGCWKDRYDGKQGADVVCVLGAHPRLHAIKALSFVGRPAGAKAGVWI